MRRRSADDSPKTRGRGPDCCGSARSDPGPFGLTSVKARAKRPASRPASQPNLPLADHPSLSASVGGLTRTSVHHRLRSVAGERPARSVEQGRRAPAWSRRPGGGVLAASGCKLAPAPDGRRTPDAQSDQGTCRAKAARAVSRTLRHRRLVRAPRAAPAADRQGVGRVNPSGNPGPSLRRQVASSPLHRALSSGPRS